MYKKNTGILLYIGVFFVLVLIDQLVKYEIRTSGGFYICNANLAFSIEPIYFILFAVFLCLVYLFYQIGKYKSQITNNKKISIPKFQIKNQCFGCLRVRILKLFEICQPRVDSPRFDEISIRVEAGKRLPPRVEAGYLKFGILLIVSGAVSNIADRVVFGCVVDFIDLQFWPVFNIADIYITIGGAMLVWKIIKKR